MQGGIVLLVLDLLVVTENIHRERKFKGVEVSSRIRNSRIAT